MENRKMQKDLKTAGGVSRRDFIRLGTAGVAAGALGALGLPDVLFAADKETGKAKRPNIVFIMADDLGYGSVGCYGATGVKTPNIDRIAREGMRFTDGHATCAVCTPTRYSVLTGRYYWRPNEKKVDWNRNRPLLIDPKQLTVPSLLKSAGYVTGAVGKWHLGFGENGPDFNSELKPGPLEIGFDYFFGMPNAHCEEPILYVENHRVVGLDPKDPIKIDYKKDARSMTGGASARIVQEDLGITEAAKAVEFIEKHKNEPFFLYFVPDNVHDPFTPNARFKGTSEIGKYGDYIHELDWMVGEVLNTLDRLKLADNTLVIFTSDNGAVNGAAPADKLKCNGDLLGQKTDVWEGGQRVSFIVRWPGTVKPGTVSDALVCTCDLLATSAEIVGYGFKDDEGPDSISMIPALKGASAQKHIRQEAVFQGISMLAVRSGDWLLIPKQGSGGMSTKKEQRAWWMGKELGRRNSDYDADGNLKPDAPEGQLYNMRTDPNQTRNVYNEHPEIVKRLTRLLARTKRSTKSRP